MSDTFSVCTFNCWAMHFSTPKRRERITLLAEYMISEECRFDVLSLQELWRNDDYEFLKQFVASHFPHSYHFKR